MLKIVKNLDMKPDSEKNWNQPGNQQTWEKGEKENSFSHPLPDLKLANVELLASVQVHCRFLHIIYYTTSRISHLGYK